MMENADFSKFETHYLSTFDSKLVLFHRVVYTINSLLL